MWDTLIIQPFTNVLLAITMVVKNFGVAIILFTLLIKLITYPLTAKQLKQTAAMQKLQSDPRYKKMMEKYRDNKEKLAEEQMKLYKETGVSPFGSCLPTLIQLPIIIGLYQSIIKAMAATPLEIFRLERLIYPFLDATKILPIQSRFLWMDLGQPERLPILGIQIPVLAIIVVATTWLQSKAMEPPTTGAGDQAAAMTKSLNIYMPILMGWMAYSLASGLALYFLVSNVATVVQYSAQGRANWSRLFPWIKTKAPEPVPAPAPALPEEDEDDEDEEPEPPKPVSKPSARAAVKQQRPQYKRKK
ncbi:MAG: YidC/Oxa1 family membrane protein insertase [Chloroflexi bacterium]|nr:membrane protein insertase YidC [Anaerolineaceae bacterium]NLI44208.1 YidC/Oxa1 family membrane protein insertase [Chloroflexota bacterium]HOE35672.1 YidC/Oxa1 family membrane protein insertase [Anaerolineaceae bacterium]HOT24924.1 YidC/Oxa1 family membrane protein insertase [Anaerolineaceae bacterium]HQH57517.1 YidC/Oxa1 family membrane protein insertase [Anaerolineaceae bacterium]